MRVSQRLASFVLIFAVLLSNVGLPVLAAATASDVSAVTAVNTTSSGAPPPSRSV